MTTPKPDLLNARHALALAFDIVSTPCSAAETQRAEVLLGIAREIREEQQYRATRSSLMSFASIDNSRVTTQGRQSEDGPVEPATFAHRGERAADRFGRLAGLDLRAGSIVSAPADFAALRVPDADDATAYMPALAERTQSLPIVWSVGDKADCRHCHTPIVFVARRMVDPVPDAEGDPRTLWIHKYTDQRACAVATMSSDDAEPTRTFAEPSV